MPTTKASVPVERHVRSRDTEQSWNAASIDPQSWSELQATVVFILALHGAKTDDELYREYLDGGFPPRSPQRIRTARKELELAGIVVASDVVGLSGLGNASQAWVLA